MIVYSALTLGTSDNGSNGSDENLLPDPGDSSTTDVITTDNSPPPDKSTENLVSGPASGPHTNGPAGPAVPSPHSSILALIGLVMLCVKPRRMRRATALACVRP